jgi:hypothetical protein
MLRSIRKTTNLGAQYACKHVRITAKMLILEIKVARFHSGVERQDSAVQRWKDLLLADSWKGGVGMTCNCLEKSWYVPGFASFPLKLLQI